MHQPVETKTTTRFMKRPSGKGPSQSFLDFCESKMRRSLGIMGYEKGMIEHYIEAKLNDLRAMDETRVAAILLKEMSPSEFHRA